MVHGKLIKLSTYDKWYKVKGVRLTAQDTRRRAKGQVRKWRVEGKANWECGSRESKIRNRSIPPSKFRQSQSFVLFFLKQSAPKVKRSSLRSVGPTGWKQRPKVCSSQFTPSHLPTVPPSYLSHLPTFTPSYLSRLPYSHFRILAAT
jgi:hypothetical protein